MTIKKYEDMNAQELDIIKEIGSIGNGNAATALSGILNAKVSMKFPEVKVLGFNEALNSLGSPEDLVAAVLVEMSGEIQGVMLYILTEEFAKEILAKMLGEEIDFMAMSEMHLSALNEIGNIMISSYISAISSLTHVEINLSVPQIAMNMLGGILSLPMAQMGTYSDRIMMMTGGFTLDGKELKSDMLLLPDVESLNVLIEKLGVE